MIDVLALWVVSAVLVHCIRTLAADVREIVTLELRLRRVERLALLRRGLPPAPREPLHTEGEYR